MEDFKFYLKANKPLTKTLIRLRHYINRNPFIYNIGYSIYPEFWDSKNFRPKKLTKKAFDEIKEKNDLKFDYDSFSKINRRIRQIISVLESEIAYYQKRGVITDATELRRTLNEKFKPNKKVSQDQNKDLPENLNQYIERYIKEIESGHRTYTSSNGEMRKYTHGTIKTYTGFQVQFNEFQKQKRLKLDFDDITLDLYDHMVRYFSNKGYSTNSIGKLAKTLKTIMRASHEEKLHSNTEYQRSKFKTLKVDVINVYLTQDEVDTLYNLDFNKIPEDKLDRKLIPEYELSRDVFLCGVWTAQRFSDYSRIKPEHIKEREGQLYFEMITKKTSELVSVPIKPELEKLLKKYSNKLPKTYEQKINSNIKEICRLAKFNDLIEVQEIRKGVKITKMIPKYKMIKTHSSRRTACTLMYLANIPTIDIMKISGHRTEKNLLKYIKVTKEETSKRLSVNPYFTSAKLKSI